MGHLFIPGPVDVNEEIAKAQTQPMLPHRSAQFEEIFRRSAENAQKIFMTQYRVFISASSGTGFHEAAVRNFVNRVYDSLPGAATEVFSEVLKLIKTGSGPVSLDPSDHV